MVDWDGLENRCACKRTVGSNPTLSAIGSLPVLPTDHDTPDPAGFQPAGSAAPYQKVMLVLKLPLAAPTIEKVR